MILQYALGVTLQVLGTLGLGWFFQKICFSKFREPVYFSIAVGLAYIFESTLLGIFSLAGFLWILPLQAYALLKAAVGLYVLGRYAEKIRNHLLKCWPLGFIFGLFLLNACVPTSNFDCFSAHLPIPKLFLAAQGYPLRPDFQYLALPLGAHMWSLPSMSLGLEGGCNAVAPLFSFFLIFTIFQFFGSKCAVWSLLVCLSMPEFIRVSLDPMVDTPCFYYACAGYLCLRSRRIELHWIGLWFWCFLFAIKPTLAPFALIAVLWYLSRDFCDRSQHFRIKTAGILILAAGIGLFWCIKNGLVHQNIFYPYLGSSTIQPLIPTEWHPAINQDWGERILKYFRVIFLDHRYNLSLGFWPLFSLPFVWRCKNGAQRWILFLLVLGLMFTLLLTPFKNRYAMPYFFVALPAMALLAQYSSLGIKILLGLSVSFNLAYALPYVGQPLYAAYKNWDKHDYYRFKFPNYSAYEKANRSPEGKILLIGQASHWLDRPHVLAVISETHLDFTRMDSIENFKHFLTNQNISFIVFDRQDVLGMAKSSDPWYRGKSWCAQRALYWVDQLLEKSAAKEIFMETGVQMIDVREL